MARAQQREMEREGGREGDSESESKRERETINIHVYRNYFLNIDFLSTVTHLKNIH